MNTHNPTHPIRAMKFSAFPLRSVSVKCEVPSDLPKLKTHLKSLDKSDPTVVCRIEESGEFFVSGAGLYHVNICLKDLQHDMGDTKLIFSKPMVSLRETVLERSCRTVMRKSPNNHNRLYMEARPMEEGLAEAIDDGRIGERDDPNYRSMSLTKEFGWDKDLGKKIWAFGPENTGPNMLIDMCKGGQDLDEIKNSVIAGFQMESKEGPLAGQKMRGICFELRDVELHNYAKNRGPCQLIPAARRVIHQSQFTAKPRLLEPVYMVEIQAPKEALEGIFRVLNQKRGRLISIAGTPPVYNIKAHLPVYESFEFSKDLRIATSDRHVFAQCVFDHWQLIPSDPFEQGSWANKLVTGMRKARGLKELSPLSTEDEL